MHDSKIIETLISFITTTISKFVVVKLVLFLHFSQIYIYIYREREREPLIVYAIVKAFNNLSFHIIITKY